MYLTQTSRPVYWNKLMVFFASPYTVSEHIDLASTLWQYGQKTSARELINSAQTLSLSARPTINGGGTVNVLGLSTRPMDTLALWEHETEALQKDYVSWQAIAAAKPDYRDAYLRLATIAYQLGNLDVSKQWIYRALELDPNNSEAKRVSTLLQ
ncbi:hypothetical protein HY949_03490 [Candidatus Gottesmanbacteria bacterium]|nr:hypothetical protein [Candidatus Gottesmanbacteria bacterium]